MISEAIAIKLRDLFRMEDDPPPVASGIPTDLAAAQRLFKAIRETEEIFGLEPGSAQPLTTAHTDWVVWQVEVFPLMIEIIDRTAWLMADGLAERPFNGLQIQIKKAPRAIELTRIDGVSRWPQAHSHWLPWTKASNDLSALYEAIQVIKNMQTMLPKVFVDPGMEPEDLLPPTQ